MLFSVTCAQLKAGLQGRSAYNQLQVKENPIECCWQIAASIVENWKHFTTDNVVNLSQATCLVNTMHWITQAFTFSVSINGLFKCKN